MAEFGKSHPVELDAWDLHLELRVRKLPLIPRFFVRILGALWVLLISLLYFRMSREGSRRLTDLGHPKREYKDDDPRKYGVYFQGESGYVPKPGEQPFIAPEPEPPDYGMIRD